MAAIVAALVKARADIPSSLLKYPEMPHAKDAKDAKSSEEIFLGDLGDLGVRLFQQSARSALRSALAPARASPPETKRDAGF